MPKLVTNLPYYRSACGRATLWYGDVLTVLKRMEKRSVHCAITSPPYWGLRSYATGENKSLEIGSEPTPDCLGWARGWNCAESDWSSACHVCRIVLVFRALRRVLRDDGTLWLNYGDTYAAGNNRNGVDSGTMLGGRKPNNPGGLGGKTGLPAGNTVGLPWRIALALQADGWILRQDIIWHKPAPLPESVRNRCTKAHEYVFLLTKGQQYFCNMEAIREKTKPQSISRVSQNDGNPIWNGNRDRDSSQSPQTLDISKMVLPTANKRSVWTVASQGYPGAHFATFPPALIEPMILAGTQEGGIVLDPFVGSGTTIATAILNGRKGVGIDLSETYLKENAMQRVGEALLQRDGPERIRILQPKRVEL